MPMDASGSVVRVMGDQQRPCGEGEILTAAEAAALLRVSERVLRRQTAAGVVPSFKLGRQVRYRRSELDALGRRQTDTPGAS